MLWGISEMVNARAFKPYAIGFSTPKNLITSGDFWSSRNQLNAT